MPTSWYGTRLGQIRGISGPRSAGRSGHGPHPPSRARPALLRVPLPRSAVGTHTRARSFQRKAGTASRSPAATARHPGIFGPVSWTEQWTSCQSTFAFGLHAQGTPGPGQPSWPKNSVLCSSHTQPVPRQSSCFRSMPWSSKAQATCPRAAKDCSLPSTLC